MLIYSKSMVYLLKGRDPVGLSASRSAEFSKWTVLIGRTGFDTMASIPDPTLNVTFSAGALYADRLGGSNGDGAWRGMVTIVELIDPRLAHTFQPPIAISEALTTVNLYDRPYINSKNNQIPFAPTLLICVAS